MAGEHEKPMTTITKTCDGCGTRLERANTRLRTEVSMRTYDPAEDPAERIVCYPMAKSIRRWDLCDVCAHKVSTAIGAL